MSDDLGDVSTLLQRWSDGDAVALGKLTPMVYAELRSLAHRALRGERDDQTMQTTALVNEAFIRLVGQDRTRWQNRSHFAAVAAQAMRRILVDEARRRNAAKRPDAAMRVELHEAVELVASPEELVALDNALSRLALLDERQARVVELKFFAGMELDEIASVLGVGSATVSRDWRLARGWLYSAMVPQKAGD